MNQRTTPFPRRATGWLLGLALLLTSVLAAAQQDPPTRVGRLNFQQGSVSFSPAGDDNWYEAVANRPLTTGDRLWADRSARAEVYVGSTAVRLDEQTGITMSEVDDNTARITATQGSLQVRVRDDLAGGRFEVDTANMAMIVDTPGDFRINVDPGSGTTQVSVAAGNVTLFGENGESTPLGPHQQLTVSGRNLAAANGAPVRAASDFDRWVAERDRIDDQSVSARYVSRDTVGYQQLDAYGDWQNDPNYGQVWYPRNVDADWAPYQNGQWAEVAPWGWTWIDAAPWGFAPTHYGRWARVGSRWCWVPGRQHARPVYAPALVGFVGGTAAGASANLAIGGGRHGVGWFPLAPGEAWRPGYRASQRYIDEANRAALGRQIAAQNAARNAEFANRLMPGAVTVVPADHFARGPIGRREVVRVPTERLASVPVGMGAPIPLHGGPSPAAFSRAAAVPPPGAVQPRQQQRQMQQFQQAQQVQQAQQALQAQQIQRQQQEIQQRAAGQAVQAQQAQQAQQLQQRAAAQAMQAQQAQQLQQVQRQQQEVQQRAAAQAMQAQQAQQLQQAQRQQQEAQQRAAAQAMQAQQAQQLQQAQRQQQEAQRRAATQQALQAQQAQQLQQAQRQQQEIQQRAAAQAMQAQQAQQAQQLQQMQRQQAEAQQRAAQAQAMQMQQQQAMRAQQQQAQQMIQQRQQAARQAQELRPRAPGRPDQPQQGLVDRP